MSKVLVSIPLTGQSESIFMIKKVKEMIREIEKDGWYLKTHKGSSHRQYTHPTKKGKVTINGKESDTLDHFLVSSIMKQAGLK